MLGFSMRSLVNTSLGFPKHLTSLWKWEYPVVPSLCALWTGSQEATMGSLLPLKGCLCTSLSFLCILSAETFIIPIKSLLFRDFAFEELTDPGWNSPGNKKKNWSWNPCSWTKGWGFHVSCSLEPAGSGSTSLESHVILPGSSVASSCLWSWKTSSLASCESPWEGDSKPVLSSVETSPAPSR